MGSSSISGSQSLCDAQRLGGRSGLVLCACPQGNLFEVGLGRQAGVPAEATVEGRERIEAGSEGQFINTLQVVAGLQPRQQVLQALLVDIAVEALAEHLVEQV